MIKIVNWSILATCCGNGAHLPFAILRLNSSNEEERKQAYWQLDNFVVVQSYLYEAAYYVIEPILELLEMPYSVDRLWPLTILTEIALGGNETTEIIMQDTGEKKILIRACQEKLKELKQRIDRIVVVSQKEIEEKQTLLWAINEME